MSRDDRHDDKTTGLRYIGSPVEFFRLTDRVYAEQALEHWETYVHRTLQASIAAGGRFNARNEFGALYAASDEDTAWLEIAARFEREGVSGLPPSMGLLRIAVLAGRYVDLTTATARKQWELPLAALTATTPTRAEEAACRRAGAAIRMVADFLQSPSARGPGRNVPIFADREDSELHMRLEGVVYREPPQGLRQQAREQW